MSKRRPLDLTLGIIGLLCAVGALSAIAISGIVPMDDRLIAGLGVGAVLLLVIAALMDFVRNPEARKCVWETALVLGLAIILAQLFEYVVLPLQPRRQSESWRTNAPSM